MNGVQCIGAHSEVFAHGLPQSMSAHSDAKERVEKLEVEKLRVEELGSESCGMESGKLKS